MSTDRWNERWQALEAACNANASTGRWQKGRKKPMRLVIGPPADAQAIQQVESGIGNPLPSSFRHVIETYSAFVDIEWQLRDHEDPTLPKELEGIFAGEIRWSLRDLPELVRTYEGWIAECFSNPDDRYDSVWHHKFPILSVMNGDMIGIETGGERKGAVVYLSHDDGEGHGYVLGTDFEDYVDRLSLVGGVGAEDWQWLPFTSSKTSGIEPDSPAATRWREWFGLRLPA